MNWRSRGVIALLCGLLLSSCGAGGGPGGSDVKSAIAFIRDLTGQSEARPLTAPEAGRLLSQATFGATDASLDALATTTPEAWIQSQIAMPPPAQTHLAAIDARLLQLQAANPAATLSSDNFYETWWRTAVTSPDQLRQRVAFAYSQIFVVSLLSDVTDPRGISSYYDMLTANAFANFRTLLENVTLHPAMGRYLTYLANQKEDATGTRTPDENYAREVMQLMTIGLVQLNPDGTPQLDINGRTLPAYTQSDISGLAKVFTGLSWYNPTPTATTFFGGNRVADATVRPMIFYNQYHSISQKTFLGTTIPASGTANGAADLNIALNTLFNHPNVGPFISRQLIQRLVTSNPSPAYVQRVASVFNNNGSGVRGDMAAVITAILMDTEARSASLADAQDYGKVREPVLRMTHWMRAFGATSASGLWRVGATASNTSLGQSPMTSPSVFNFYRPGYVPPGTTALGSRMLNAPEFQIIDEVTTAGYVNTLNQAITSGIGVSADVRSAYAAELAVAGDANQLVSRMDRLLLSGQMSPTLRTRVVEAVNSIAIPASPQAQIDLALLNRVRTAILLVMASSEYMVQR